MDYFNTAPFEFNPTPEEEAQVKADRDRAILEQRQMQEQAKQEKLAQQKAAQQKQQLQAEEQSKSLGGRLQEAAVIGATPGLAVADFAADAMGMVPWLKPIDEWWDKNSPRSKNPLVNATREVASVVIPTVLGSKFAIGKLSSATAGASIPKAVRVLGSVAAAAGVDTAVTGISSTSEQDNAAAFVNEMLGHNYLPWATLPEDSPDVKRKKNMLEAAGLSVGADVISAFFAGRRALKLVPKDMESAAIIKANEDLGTGAKLADEAGNPIPSENDVDPVTAAVENRQISREDELVKEGAARLNESPDGGYDPYINELGDPEGRPLTGVNANAVEAKVDNFLIQRNELSLDGQMTPPLTRETERLYNVISGDKSERAKALSELFSTMQPNADALVGSKRYAAEDINRAVDTLAEQMVNPAISFDEFKQIVENTKTNVYESHKLLGEGEWVVASGALKNLFEAISPNNIRASAMMTQSAANDVANLSWAVRNIGDYADTAEHQKLIWEKMGLIAGEVRANQRAAGITLQLKKLASEGSSWDEVTAFMRDADQSFARNLADARAEGAAGVRKLQAIAEENPELFKAIYPVFEATNGKIDDINKLFRFAENYVGVLGKGIINAGDPEVASAFINGMHQTRYNNILFGPAIIRAAAGNAINTVLKPTTALLGSVGRDSEAFKRALWGFGGISENLKRATKAMSDEWRVIRDSPLKAAMGRADDPYKPLEFVESMDIIASKWMEQGDYGRVAAWNLTKGMAGYNANSFVRFGTDSLKTLDVFVRSMSQSLAARFRAYDDLLKNGGDRMTSSEFLQAFDSKQKELYNSAFDETGLLRKPFDEADFSAKEMTMNLDNELVSRLEGLMQRVPAAKPLFMFPRTGLNALEMAWSYTPMSALGGAVGRARKALKATTPEEITEVLMEHGINANAVPDPDAAFAAIKSEYYGRQLVGGLVTTMAGIWALEGNLTGNGPQDAAEKRRMISLGWKPLSIRNPITGDWHTYQGFEPFDSILGLVADGVYQATRVDQAVSEDLFRKVSFAISSNITNKSFLSGIQVVTDLLSGDEGAWNRFFALQADSTIPFTGLRSILSKTITPQLKDVENDFAHYLGNRNKYLFSSDEELKNMLDIYTGKPISYWEPFTAAANALTPFFKTNGGTEPWREWLIKTGWDGLKVVNRNPITGSKATPEQRQWVNNWIAQNADLAGQIESMRSAPDNFWNDKIKEYVKRRGQQTQEQYPVEKMVVFEELDRIHGDAFRAAWNAYAMENQAAMSAGRFSQMRNRQLGMGDLQGATDTQQQLEALLAYPK